MLITHEAFPVALDRQAKTLVGRSDERKPVTEEGPRRVVFVAGATAFSLLGDQALYAVLPVYYGSLGLSAIEVGILLSANRWIRLLTNDLAHRLGGDAEASRLHKWMFVAAFLLGAVTTLAYGLTASFTLLLLARLAWGLAWSFIRHLGVQAIMTGSAAERPGRTMGLYNGISRAGSVAGLLGGAVLVDVFGFQAGMLCLAAITLLSLPLAAMGHRGDRPLADPGTGSLPLTLKLGGFAVGIVGPGFVMSTLGAALAGYVDATTLLSAATLTGFLLALRYAMDAFAAAWLGGLADRFGVGRSAVVFFLVGGSALLISVLAPPLPLFMGLILIFFVCGTGLQAGLAGTASRLGSGAFARYVTLSDLGAAVGPLVGWLVVDWLEDPLLSLGLGGVTYLLVAFGVRKKTWQG